MATIGENIKKLREKNGMSQSELAAKIGKSRTAVWQCVQKVSGQNKKRPPTEVGERKNYQLQSIANNTAMNTKPPMQRIAISI